jgi:hypothetical protein
VTLFPWTCTCHGDHDGRTTGGDREIDREGRANATLDQDVEFVLLNAGLNAEGAGQRVDDPVAGCVGCADAYKEVDVEADDVKRRADVERDVLDIAGTERKIGQAEIIAYGELAVGEVNVEPGAGVAFVGGRGLCIGAAYGAEDILQLLEKREELREWVEWCVEDDLELGEGRRNRVGVGVVCRRLRGTRGIGRGRR